MKGKLKKIILWSITAIVAISAGIFGINNFTSVKAEEFIDGKELKENGDGTYQLSLSVTGQSEKKVNKANVIVILDISGSMDYGTEYTTNNNGGYGYVNGKYEFLYYSNFSGYHKIGNGTHSGTVYYVNNGYYQQYTGTRYSAKETRLDAAKRAVNNLADSLLKNNTTENNDIIEIALVTFSTNATTSQTATTSYNTFSNKVNGLSADGGTNWEAALKQAKSVSFGTNDKDTTYVIFVSDGNPTFHVTDGGYNNANSNYSGIYGSGQEVEPNITRSYDQAKDDAKALVDSKYEFYTIGIYGNVDRMKDLTTYSGVSATDNYFSAEDTAKLESALNTILQKIETAGIGEVGIEDGTTQSVVTDSGKLNLLTIDYTDENNNSFRYWLSFPVTNNNGVYTAKVNNIDATISVNSNGGYTCTWGENSEYSLDGVIEDGMFKYEWTGANALYNKEAPKATLANSKVNWDLSDLDVLLNGVTYTVTFNVWPSQETYDLISDIDNGIKSYDDLDDVVKTYLVSDGNGGYTLLTNTRASLTYTDTRNDEGEQTAYYKNPEPVSTDVSKMTVKKLWENKLDQHQSDVKKVELNVLKDGSKYGDTITLTKDSDGEWKDEVFISAGLMSINKDSNGNIVSAIVREKGHNYTFEEIEDGTYYWDLAVETVRPMIVNEGDKLVLKTFVKVEDNAPTIGNSNVTTVDGVTYYKIDGDVYYVRETNAAIMNAVNIRRSNLNITKVVTGSDAPEDAEFNFKLKVNDYNGNNVWFSIYDPKTGTVKDDKYVSATGLNKEIKDGEFTGFYYVASGTEITVTMQANWNLRFTNLPTGSTYTFEETTMPDNFAFVEATGTTVSARVELLPEGATANEDGTYTYNGVVYTKVEENGDVYYTYDGKINVNDKVVTGRIYVGNTSYTVTYTNDYLKTHVSGTKVWNDNDNQDGKRPTEITVELVAKVSGTVIDSLGGTTTVKEASDKTWKYEFTDLNRYYEGKTIEYSIKELEVDGYSSSITTAEDGSYVITNTHTPEKITVSGTKTWKDEIDNTNRPSEVTINLEGKVGDEVVKTASTTTSSANEWKYEFTGLDKYKGGVEIKYTVTESAVEGYVASYDGYNVINTLDTKEISVNKVWKDDIEKSNRPDSIKVELYAGEKLYSSATLNTANEWKYTFTDLPVYSGNKKVEYSIKEVEVTGYTSKLTGNETDGYTITNTLDTTTVSGIKSWEDNNNQDGIRPSKVIVYLKANGESEASIEVSEAGGWKYAFTDLPVYRNGKKVEYTVSESYEGYTTTYDGYNIKNTHVPEKTEVNTTKVWDDNNNQDGKRPTSITVNLLVGEEVVKTCTTDSSKEWKCSFTDLDKYANGKEIEYTVSEVEPEGYKSTVDGYEITNTHTVEKTEVNTTKVWNDNNNQDGKRPTTITVNLLIGEEVVKTCTTDSSKEWKCAFTDLDKYKDGKEIKYTVSEVDPEGYKSTVDGYEITNTHTPEKTVVNTTKVWNDNNNQDGKRPTEITVNLLVNDEVIKTCTTDSSKEWKCSFTDLDKYKDGKEIKYTVSEVVPEGYLSSVNGYEITNRYDPEKTEVHTTKVWDDNNNQDGKRPTTITVNLLIGEEVVKTCTTDSSKEWKCAFTDLDKFADGKVIEYTVSEVAPQGYTATVDGYKITNTHVPEKTSVVGKKTWVDSDNIEELRPTEITVRLKADGVEVASNTIKEGSDGEWTYSFTNLDKYKDGKEIEYTVVEDPVDKYETSYDKENPYIIVNTHNPKAVEISVKKEWIDESKDGLKNIYGHDSEVVVKLVGKVGEKEHYSEEVTLSSENEWMHTFENLPEYREGKLISYSVSEVTDVKNYSVNITNKDNEYTITNTYSPKTFDIEGVKTWVDSDDNDDIRPDSIELVLTDNYDNEIARKTVTSKDNWEYKFENLPVYDKSGEEIIYTLNETEVDGYTTKIEDYNVTNTHELETVSFNITKVWNDNNNNDGLRPSSIVVRLKANGVEVANAVIDEKGGWAYSFEGFNKYANGELIVYTIDEDEVSGYTTEISKVNDNSFEVVNTHKDEYVPITITKTWDDMDDVSEIRPEEITVNVYADGTKVKTVTISKEDNWAKTITDLKKYANGKEIKYTITEEEVFEYETTINGFNIINKHELGIGGGPQEEPEILPPQTGVVYTETKDYNYIIYMMSMLLSLFNASIAFSQIKKMGL